MRQPGNYGDIPVQCCYGGAITPGHGVPPDRSTGRACAPNQRPAAAARCGAGPSAGRARGPLRSALFRESAGTPTAPPPCPSHRSPPAGRPSGTIRPAGGTVWTRRSERFDRPVKSPAGSRARRAAASRAALVCVGGPGGDLRRLGGGGSQRNRQPAMRLGRGRRRRGAARAVCGRLAPRANPAARPTLGRLGLFGSTSDTQSQSSEAVPGVRPTLGRLGRPRRPRGRRGRALPAFATSVGAARPQGRVTRSALYQGALIRAS